MKLISKISILIIAIFTFSVAANAQSEWVGEYFFSEDGGETVGGTKIYIAHTLKITEKDGKLKAHIYSQGFQTSRDIYADVKVDSQKLMLTFSKAGESHNGVKYSPGDLLLELRQELLGKTKILLTKWGEFKSVTDRYSRPESVYFVKKKTKKDEPLEWMEITTNNEELKISVPQNYSFSLDEMGYDSKNYEYNSIRSITAFENGVSMWLESFEVKDAHKAFHYLPDFAVSSRNWNQRLDEYTLGAISKRKKEITVDGDYYVKRYYFHTKDRIYCVGFGARDKKNPTIKKFLQTFEFNGESQFAFDETAVSAASKKVIWEDIKETNISIDYAVNSETTSSLNSIKTSLSIFQKASFKNTSSYYRNKSIVILTKPLPGYTKLAREKNVTGSVLLIVTFRTNGLISGIKVKDGLDSGLTERAIEATKRIRFLPPERNGIPYNVRKTVSFGFLIY